MQRSGLCTGGNPSVKGRHGNHKGKEVIKALIIVDMKSMKQDNVHLPGHFKSEDFLALTVIRSARSGSARP